MKPAPDAIAVHQPIIEVRPSIAAEIDAAIDVGLTIRVACPEGCDLRGAPIAIMADDAVLLTSPLVAWEDRGNLTAQVACRAPETAGPHAWSVVFARYETDRCIHNESALPVSFATRPHATSMSVWGVPSPVVVNSPFTVHVGVKCSVPCQLTGRLVEICNDAGVKVGEGRLGEAPWPGTDALYWTTVATIAPADEGVSAWIVRFAFGDALPPHDESSVAFTFRTARRPEAVVTIEVVATDSARVLDDVELRLGPYEAFTDEHGVATVAVPHGTYGLDIRKDGFQAAPIAVDVRGDLRVRIEAAPAATKAEIEDMMKRFEGETWR